ncbi:MAG TPA: hypothetical protein VIW72_03415 [Burkholderiales bacterium]
MRFNLTALSLTAGIFCGGSILIVIVVLVNLIWPGYGQAFLDLAASIYPGYHAGTNIRQAITGTLYGFVDGAIGGALFGWIYNLLSR